MSLGIVYCKMLLQFGLTSNGGRESAWLSWWATVAEWSDSCDLLGNLKWTDLYLCTYWINISGHECLFFFVIYHACYVESICICSINPVILQEFRELLHPIYFVIILFYFRTF